jgi:hypothetical protein
LAIPTGHFDREAFRRGDNLMLKIAIALAATAAMGGALIATDAMAAQHAARGNPAGGARASHANVGAPAQRAVRGNSGVRAGVGRAGGMGQARYGRAGYGGGYGRGYAPAYGSDAGYDPGYAAPVYGYDSGYDPGYAPVYGYDRGYGPGYAPVYGYGYGPGVVPCVPAPIPVIGCY